MPGPDYLDQLGCEAKDISPDFNDFSSMPRLLLKLSCLEIRVAELEKSVAARLSWWRNIFGGE